MNMRTLTPRAFAAMQAQGRIEFILGRPHITITLPEPGGALIKERIEVAETEAWDFVDGRWHFVPKPKPEAKPEAKP